MLFFLALSYTDTYPYLHCSWLWIRFMNTRIKFLCIYFFRMFVFVFYFFYLIITAYARKEEQMNLNLWTRKKNNQNLLERYNSTKGRTMPHRNYETDSISNKNEGSLINYACLSHSQSSHRNQYQSALLSSWQLF